MNFPDVESKYYKLIKTTNSKMQKYIGEILVLNFINLQQNNYILEAKNMVLYAESKKGFYTSYIIEILNDDLLTIKTENSVYIFSEV